MKLVFSMPSAPHSNERLGPSEMINRCHANARANTSIYAIVARTTFKRRHMLLSACNTPYICVLHDVGRSKFEQRITIRVAYFRISVHRCSHRSCIVRSGAVDGCCETGTYVNAFALYKLHVMPKGSTIMYQGSYDI